MKVWELIDELYDARNEDMPYYDYDVKIALDYEDFHKILALEVDEKNKQVILWP